MKVKLVWSPVQPHGMAHVCAWWRERSRTAGGAAGADRRGASGSYFSQAICGCTSGSIRQRRSTRSRFAGPSGPVADTFRHFQLIGCTSLKKARKSRRRICCPHEEGLRCGGVALSYSPHAGWPSVAGAAGAAPALGQSPAPPKDPDAVCAGCHRNHRYAKRTPMAHASGPAAEGFIAADLTHAASGVHYRMGLDQGQVWLSWSEPMLLRIAR